MATNNLVAILLGNHTGLTLNHSTEAARWPAKLGGIEIINERPALFLPSQLPPESAGQFQY